MSAGKTKKLISRIARFWKVWAGIAGLTIVILWTAGACTRKVAPGEVEHLPGKPLPAEAVLIVTSNEMVSSRIDVVGTVASEEKIHLSARMPAYIKEVFVSAGDSVKAGQLLIALDDREINEQFAAANAALNQAETEFNRTRRLFETEATTEQALDAAESAFKSARANVDRIKVMLTYARITSPIDGMVTDRRVEAGDLANPGQVLLAVYDPDNMRLEAPVPVRLLDKLPRSRVVDVVLDGMPGVIKGRVREIVGEVDPMSRTQKVKIHLEEIGGTALPGTFGRVWVEEEPHPAVLLPVEAVYRVGQLEYVQIVRRDRILRRLVKTGQAYGDRIEIISGLRAGQTVLENPIF